MMDRWPFYWLRATCNDCKRQKPKFTKHCDECAARHDLGYKQKEW